MAGVAAGRLSIEIVAEIARLQQDLDKAKRAVKSMSNDIARDTKAANDNLARVGTGFANSGRMISSSAGAQRAAMTQLSFQLDDIAQGFAMGTRPMTIFAQQSGQVIQALSLMTGNAKGFLGFLGGPWGMVISAAAVVLAPLVAKMFEMEDATKGVEFASYKLSDAQSILGRVMDLQTGKINTQKDALLALAKAQIIAGQVQARQDMASARHDMIGFTKDRLGFAPSGLPIGFGLKPVNLRGPEGDIVSAFMAGGLNTSEAVKGLQSLNKTGMITEKTMLQAMKAVTDFGVAAENLKVFQDAEKGLGGDKSALAQFLNPAKAKKPKKGPDPDEIQKRFEDQLVSITQATLSARESLATSAEDRAELEMRSLEWERLQKLAMIRADKDFSAAQKKDLIDATEELASFQRELVERKKNEQLQQEAQQIAQAQHDAANDNLQTQLALADTEQARKDLALQIFDADNEYLKASLERVVTAHTINGIQDQQAKLAQIQLDALAANSGLKRDAVGRANETSVEKYLREMNKTPEQMNEAFDQIKMNGLDAFRDGIVDAIVNFKSLGDVAKNVLRQILADLLKLEVEKAIIGPLANLLGLGSSSAGGSLYSAVLSAPFGGGHATGGFVSAGTAYTVGERGPETFVPSIPGRIVPNGANDNMGNTYHINVTVPGAMNERQARETGDQVGRRIRRQIKGIG